MAKAVTLSPIEIRRDVVLLMPAACTCTLTAESVAGETAVIKSARAATARPINIRLRTARIIS